jgi:hypothetical protein
MIFTLNAKNAEHRLGSEVRNGTSLNMNTLTYGVKMIAIYAKVVIQPISAWLERIMRPPGPWTTYSS